MRIRLALLSTLIAAGAVSGPVLALNNPIVADVVPIDGAAIHGNVTLFQLGDNVNVGLNLSGSDAAAVAVDIRKGTCKSYAQNARWPIGDATETRLPSMKLDQLVGNVVLIHKSANESSAPIACAEIRG